MDLGFWVSGLGFRMAGAVSSRWTITALGSTTASGFATTSALDGSGLLIIGPQVHLESLL